MNENNSVTQSGRDPETGQFILGHTGSGGRPKGSRNRLSERFLIDLEAQWEKSGADVLERVAKDDPVDFMRVVAGLLPSKVDASLAIIDADLLREQTSFMAAYKLARSIIGADAEDTPLIEASDEAKAKAAN
jgi:hypothetical protein